MTEPVREEEVQAILDAVGEEPARAASDVQPRDFHQPRRLSRKRLRDLSSLVEATLRDAGRRIADQLRGPHKLKLASLSEVSARDLFAGYEAPFLVLCFECAGHPSWVLWDSAAAVAAVEVSLSGPGGPSDAEDAAPEEYEPRRLSSAECRVITQLLEAILQPVGEALGIPPGPGRIAQEPDEVATLEAAGPEADERRLMLHLAFDGPGGASDLRLYLPEPRVRQETGARSGGAPPVTDHLESVQFDVTAYLGAVDVPLNELLALEVGDVIQLGVDAGTPVELYVEDRACAHGHWGLMRGRPAVRIEEIHTHPSEIDQPED